MVVDGWLCRDRGRGPAELGERGRADPGGLAPGGPVAAGVILSLLLRQLLTGTATTKSPDDDQGKEQPPGPWPRSWESSP